MNSIDFIVRRHHGCRIGVSSDNLERAKVYLSESSLSDDDIHRASPVLLVIADKVLDGGGNPSRLAALDHLAGQDTGKVRIFGKAFEATATQSRARNVDCWTKPAVGSLGNAFFTEECSSFL